MIAALRLHVAHSDWGAVPTEIPAGRPRKIGREAGRALEILGHAIEYLADEYALGGGPISPSDPAVRAMRILMERNREIYFACPVVLTLGARWRAFLRGE